MASGRNCELQASLTTLGIQSRLGEAQHLFARKLDGFRQKESSLYAFP